MPAVVVGHHGERGVAELGLAGESRLGEVGHADYRDSPGAIESRFGQRRELRTFHTKIRAPLVHGRAGVARGRNDRARQLRVDRPGKLDVGNYAVVIEERVDAVPRAIDELIDHDHVARMNVLLHRTHCRHAEDLLRARHLEGEDVGSVVDTMGREAVPAAVSG